MDDEYLKIFSQISKGESNPEKEQQPIQERPDYSQYENLSRPRINQYEMLNETPDLSRYQINENLNDGWNIDFQFETRINGVPLNDNSYPAPAFNRRQNIPDPNGLNKYLGENLNEVYHEQEVLQPINEVVKFDSDLVGPINENLNELAVVSVELFNKINSRAFMGLASTVDIHKLQGGV